MASLLDQHGDALMALGRVTPSFQPTAIVISVDVAGNLQLEQKLQPGVQLDPSNPAHRIANWIVLNASQVLSLALSAPMAEAAAPRVITLN